MKVFRLTFDINRYQYLLTDPLSDSKRLWMDGTPIDEGSWVPPSVYVLYPKRPKADFMQSNDTVLISKPRATEVLYHHLAWAGEVLPLPYGDEIYSLTNVTKCIDVLDRENTVHRRGGYSVSASGVERFAFHRERFVETTLFKIPDFACYEIFVLEGNNDFEMEFREEVETAGLTGLIFTEIWSDEE